MRTVTILFLAANPSNESRLRLDKERREIEDKMRGAKYRERFHLIDRWAVRPDDLLHALLECKPDIVHFSGHGSPAEEIMFEDDLGAAHPIATDALRVLFQKVARGVRVVILNACFSRTQADAVSPFIDCTIGMSGAIDDDAAIAFASSFYRTLAYGRSIAEAFNHGTLILLMEHRLERNTPELLVREGIHADHLFLLESAEEGEPGRIAHTAILHGAEHPSAIVLPIVEPE